MAERCAWMSPWWSLVLVGACLLPVNGWGQVTVPGDRAAVRAAAVDGALETLRDALIDDRR